MVRYLNIYIFFLIVTLVVIIVSFYQVGILDKKTTPKINESVIEYLRSFQRGIITSSIVTFQSNQKILAIDSKNDRKELIPVANIPYDAKMEILYEGKTKTTIYFGTRKNNFSIFVPDGTLYKKGTLSDLKVGDTILLERVFKYDVSGKDYADNIYTKITKINI